MTAIIMSRCVLIQVECFAPLHLDRSFWLTVTDYMVSEVLEMNIDRLLTAGILLVGLHSIQNHSYGCCN